MSLEDRCRYLEVQNITLNERLWELSGRVANIEQLLANHVIAAYPNNTPPPATNHPTGKSAKSEELYRKLSTLAFEFNNMLPAVAEAIRINQSRAVENAAYFDNTHRARDELEHGSPLGSISSNQVLSQPNRPPSIPMISVTSDTFTNQNQNQTAQQPSLPPIPSKNSHKKDKSKKNNSHGMDGSSPDLSVNEVQNYVRLPPVSAKGSRRTERREESGMNEMMDDSNSTAYWRKSSDSPTIRPNELKRPTKRDHNNGDTYGEESDDISSPEGSDNNIDPSSTPPEEREPTVKREASFDEMKGKVENQRKSPGVAPNAPKHPPRCKKLCDKTTGHQCGQPHDPSSPCPPCIVLIKDMKLKCNHRVTILCHRKNKVSDICSECDSKKQINTDVEKGAVARPSFTIALEPIQSPGEIAFKRIREILNKITMSNFEKLSDEFVEIMDEQAKYLPEIANIVLERAIMDMDNPLSAVCYSQLASKVVENSQGREFKMFRIELITLVFAVFSNFFGCHNSCSGSSSVYVNNILRKKEIAEADIKRRKLGVLRFIGELYNKDVIKLVDLKNNVIDPFLDHTSNDQTDFLCKILTLVGHRINSEIQELDKLPPTSPDPELPSTFWFNELFIRIESIMDDPDVNSGIRFSITNLLELKQAGWDRFKKNSAYSTLQNSNNTNAQVVESSANNAYSVESDPCTSETISEKTKRRRKKKSTGRNERYNETRSPSPAQSGVNIEHLLPSNTSDYNFDSWSTAPWGEHTDPLSVAFPPLERSDSPDSPVQAGPPITGSRSQSNSRRGSPEPDGQGRRSSVTFSTIMPPGMPSRSQSMLSINSPGTPAPSMSKPALKSTNASAMTNKRVETIFIEYMKRDGAPKHERREWLQKKFLNVGEPQRAEFVRAISRLSVRQLTRVQLAGIGHILDVMMSANIVSMDTIIKCFSGGVISDFPRFYAENQKDYPDIIAKSAYILVTLFNDTMTDLEWLVRVGKNLRSKHVLIWFEFSCEVMMIIMDRKRHKGILKLWNQTEQESQNILEEQAMQIKII